MKNLLLPNLFRRLGWIIFAPALLWGILRYIGIINLPLETGLLTDRVTIIAIALGAVFVVASKESIEDEMTRAIRHASLLNALYVYMTLLVICSVTLNQTDFQQFMVINLVLFPIIYTGIFGLEVYRYHRMSRDEE